MKRLYEDLMEDDVDIMEAIDERYDDEPSYDIDVDDQWAIIDELIKNIY